MTIYSPENLREKAFAFDGEVIDVLTVADPRLPAELPDEISAVFRVRAWYSGGSQETVTVTMQRDVTVGERLLVAGEPRWGGAPLDLPIAHECGYTSVYSEERATEWAEAFVGS